MFKCLIEISIFDRYSGGMAGKELALGATGNTMMHNLKRIRGEMTYAELSRRLEAAGRYIPPLGLRRMEAGERRVDVDDLMALAFVLGVTPLALLLPHGNQRDAAEVGNKSVRHDEIWQWAMGDRPLEDVDRRRFQADSLPSWLEVRTITAVIGRGAIPVGEFDKFWDEEGRARGDS
jgi:hypothetical protein